MYKIETHINEDGIAFVDKLARNTIILDLDSDGNQVYIPGLSFPEHPILRDGFNYPIIGDNEPCEVSTSWLQGIPGNKSHRRIQFAGVLPAEEITIGEPAERELFYTQDSSDDEMEADEAFDEITGEYGGILYVQINYVEEDAPAGNFYDVVSGDAEFIVIDDMAELDKIIEDAANNLSFIGAVNFARNKLRQSQ